MGRGNGIKRRNYIAFVSRLRDHDSFMAVTVTTARHEVTSAETTEIPLTQNSMSVELVSFCFMNSLTILICGIILVRTVGS